MGRTRAYKDSGTLPAASGSWSPDDGRSRDDRGQGQGARTADRPEPGIPGGEARQRRARPGSGGGGAAEADGAAPHERAADAAARRAADRGDGEAARRAARPGAGTDGVSAPRRRTG